MKKYNVGVIGIGDISKVYLDNLKEFPDIVQLYACASRNIENAKKKANEYGFVKAYESGDALTADPNVDIVLNLTTPDVHYYYNVAALKAGKHVYSEKPLAETFEQGEEIIKLAKEKNLYVGCAPDTFMGSRIQEFRRIIDSGEIGSVFGGTATMVCCGWEWFHPNPAFYYQPGAGPLLDMGPYYLSALIALLGPVESVCAMGGRAHSVRKIHSERYKGQEIPVNVDTHISATLQFVNGAIVTFCMSFDVCESELPRMEIYGTKGTLCMKECDPCDGPGIFGGDIWLRKLEECRWLQQPRLPEKLAQDWMKVKTLRPYNSSSHAKNSRGIGLIDIIYAIDEKREARASGQMALHSLEVMKGILESAKEKKFVTMSTTCEIPKAIAEDGNLSIW